MTTNDEQRQMPQQNKKNVRSPETPEPLEQSLRVAVMMLEGGDAKEAIIDSVEEVLDAITKEAGSAAERKGSKRVITRPTIRVLGVLASDGECVLFERLKDCRRALEVILPWDEEELEQRRGGADLAKSIATGPQPRIILAGGFDPIDPRSGPEHVARLQLLEHADLLVAVCPKNSACEPPLPCSALVSEALDAGIPVVWIDPERAGDWEIYAERSHACAGSARGAHEHAARADELKHLVRELLLPPDVLLAETKADQTASSQTVKGMDARQEKLRSIRERFEDEQSFGWARAPGRMLGGLWSAFEWLMTIPRAEKRQDDTQSDGEPAVLRREYAWANHLSGYYMQLYRSSFLLNYMLGAAAVSFALAPTLVESSHAHAVAGWIGAELAAIVMILTNYFVARRCAWHDRALDYRVLAEQIRHVRAMRPLGRIPPYSRPPLYYSSQGGLHWAWVSWYVRAVIRAAGMPSVRLDTAHLQEACGGIGKWIEKQHDYHDQNASRLERFDQRVHRGAGALFALTFLACLAHFVEDQVGEWLGVDPRELSPWLTAAAAALPAWGAALHGVSTQAELASLVDRSEGMANTLERQKERLDHAQTCIANKTKDGALVLTRVARDSAEMMVHEVVDWRLIYQAHEIPLP